MLQTEQRVIPVAVKAEEDVRARSMSEYIKSHPEYLQKGLHISMVGYHDSFEDAIVERSTVSLEDSPDSFEAFNKKHSR